MKDSEQTVRAGLSARASRLGRAAAGIAEGQRRAGEYERALRESEEKYRTLFMNLGEEVHFWRVVRNRAGQIKTWRLLDINPAGLKAWGKTRAQVQGKLVEEFFPGATKHFLPIVQKVMTEGRAHSYETYFPGLKQHLRLTSVPLGECFITTGIDISRFKKTEAELRASEERLRAILNTVVDAVLTIDRRGTMRSANPATARMFGYTEGEMVGRNVKMLMSPLYREHHDEFLKRYRRTGVSELLGSGREFTAQRKDGTIFPIELFVSRLNHLPLFTGVIRNLTARKELERGISEVSEREQRRIGQDLHDGLCQHLAAIEFRLLGLKQKLEARAADVEAAEATALAKLLREGIEHTRTLARGLSPVILEPSGLMHALGELASATEKTFGVSCSFNCPQPVLISQNSVATHLYRIAQEAVHNAIRHGKSRFIVINLIKANRRVILGVKDDGIGLPESVRPNQGMGLRIMQYRAGLVGGSLLVQRDPQGGTSVICSLRAHESEGGCVVVSPACTRQAPKPVTARRVRGRRHGGPEGSRGRVGS